MSKARALLQQVRRIAVPQSVDRSIRIDFTLNYSCNLHFFAPAAPPKPLPSGLQSRAQRTHNKAKTVTPPLVLQALRMGITDCR